MDWFAEIVIHARFMATLFNTTDGIGILVLFSAFFGWVNRLLALPIGLQNCIFDEFLALVEARVAAAREAGTLDVGVETMTVETATVLDDTILRTDPVSKATSHLLTIEVTRRRNPMSLERVLRKAKERGRGSP
jgi:hypothetical protein